MYMICGVGFFCVGFYLLFPASFDFFYSSLCNSIGVLRWHLFAFSVDDFDVYVICLSFVFGEERCLAISLR